MYNHTEWTVVLYVIKMENSGEQGFADCQGSVIVSTAH